MGEDKMTEEAKRIVIDMAGVMEKLTPEMFDAAKDAMIEVLIKGGNEWRARAEAAEAALVTARDEGRREGLEAAAKVAEHRHNEWQRLGSACLVDDDISACADIAIAIRALIGGDGNG